MEQTISKEERNWAMFSHLSAFIGLVIPLANIVAPLIFWQMKKEDMPFASAQAKEALNFQIAITIYVAIASLLIFVLIGFVLVPIIVIADIILVIMAAIKASEGTAYRYPWTLRLVG